MGGQNNEMRGLILICLVLHIRELVSANYVPVIIWGPHIQNESAVAFRSHSDYEFVDILRKHSTIDTITFIVVEDQLSVEDLSHCKAPNGQTCFNGIQSIETKLYLPSVEYPGYVIEGAALGEADWIEINLLSSANFSESLKSRTGNYVFVNFGDDSYTNETVSEKLTRHDRMITSFYKNFLSQYHRQIMVVFTGKRAANRVRFPREVSTPFTYFEAETDSPNSTDSNDTTIWKTESVLMYYTSIDLEISNETMLMNVKNMTVQAANWTNTKEAENDTPEVEGDGQEFNDTSSTENDAHNDVNATQKAAHLIVTMSVNEADLLKFVITTANGYWWAYQFTWNGEPLISNRRISAPIGFSYHCTPAIRLTPEANKNATSSNGTETQYGSETDASYRSKPEGNRTEIVITWNGLQLQPKFVYVDGETLASFGDAYDCVGFVSSGIVSGLFVVFLLLFILFIGILCMMDIKTNDQFEDPKRPAMTITVSE